MVAFQDAESSFEGLCPGPDIVKQMSGLECTNAADLPLGSTGYLNPNAPFFFFQIIVLAAMIFMPLCGPHNANSWIRVKDRA